MPLRLLAICLAAAWALASAPPAHAAGVRVAILPLAVHSGEPDTAYLSAGLADMLSARLEMSGAIEVVRVESNARHTALAPALEVGRAAGADYVLFGSFTHFGAGASLDVQCVRVGESEPRDEPRRIFVQSGTLGEIIPKVDDLAARVEAFLVRGSDDDGAVAGSIPAGPSLERLERRVEALERALERLSAQGAARPAHDGGPANADGNGSASRDASVR